VLCEIFGISSTITKFNATCTSTHVSGRITYYYYLQTASYRSQEK
jgi:hypothetical protein